MESFPNVRDRMRRFASTVDVWRIDDAIDNFRLRLWVEKDTWLIGLQQLLLLYNLWNSQEQQTVNNHRVQFAAEVTTV